MTHPNELCMWLIVRKDIEMSRGKMAAQVGHAVAELIRDSTEGRFLTYMANAQPKVVLAAPNLKALERARDEAKAAGLTYAFIVDAGRTELPPDTPTVVGIGPHTSVLLPKYIKRLRLY